MSSTERLFTPEIEAFVRDSKGIKNKDLVKVIADKFGKEYRPEQLAYWRKNHSCPSGYDSRFKTGSTPFCKGKKPEEYCSPEAIERMRRTQFKKGNKPHNYLGDGVPRLRNLQKRFFVRDNGKWRLRHRVEYERLHGVKLGRKDIILFADRNPENFSPENLIKVDIKESSKINGLYKDVDASLFKSCIYLTQLETLLNQKGGYDE